MKIEATCCEWKIPYYPRQGTETQLDGKTARISGHRQYPDGWYFIIGFNIESPANFCLQCGKKCE
jgi:hypothetical protein